MNKLAHWMDIFTVIISSITFVLSAITTAWFAYLGFYMIMAICVLIAFIMLWLAVSTLRELIIDAK